ncbi:MAG: DUF2116 family Zn-ribbon domain-containing protein [Helicobacteraceae bacterium]|jgi:predicted nucleic acid-binding Zn ribbon protein|nr:DUF2116 family Zn-ribbon domain-containing protein [Helicobacteraceae bacterium]
MEQERDASWWKERADELLSTPTKDFSAKYRISKNTTRHHIRKVKDERGIARQKWGKQRPESWWEERRGDMLEISARAFAKKHGCTPSSAIYHAKSMGLPPRVCPICGNEVPRLRAKKYCSEKCQIEGYQKKKEEHRERALQRRRNLAKK